MINIEFKSLFDLQQVFNTEEKCIEHLEELRWDNNIISPFDASSKVYKCKDHRYRCKNTGKYFNVRTNTLFDNSKIDIRKWFMAIWLVTSHKKGISSYQLARDISVTQKTAWFMLQRIRKCFDISDSDPKLNGIVEVDETFVGGKNKNRHFDKKVKYSQGRSFKDKTPVLGMVERGGRLKAKVIPDTSRKSITPIILDSINLDATIYSDEWQGYNIVKKLYNHDYVDHGRKQYVNGEVYTNTIEGFWSILKRGIIGIYHLVSRKHLQQYVNEFVFRYNNRKIKESDKFNLFLQNMEQRLTYKQLIHG